MIVFKRYNKSRYFVIILGYIISLLFGLFATTDRGSVSATDILTIQPGVDEGKDATITTWNNMVSVNFGGEGDLYGGIVRMSQWRSLIEFNISSSLAPDANVTSAELSVYSPALVYAENPIALSIYRIDQSWDEATVNWLNQPAFSVIAESTIEVNDPNVSGWQTFDITDLVREWVLGEINGDLVNGYLNYGVLIDYTEIAGIDTPVAFYTSDYLADASLRPKLRVQGEEGLPLVQFDRTLQPDAAGGKDTQICDMSPATNYAIEDDMMVGGMDFSGRSFFEFDISDLPAGSEIVSASLQLNYGGTYFVNDIPVSLRAKRVSESWEENSINWLNQPQFESSAEDEVIIGDSSSSGWHSFDITNLVQGWLDGDFSNYGIMVDFIEATSNTDVKTFYSSEYAVDTTLRPKLVIEYGESAPISAPVYHKQCAEEMCLLVEGHGEDTCSVNSDCQISLSTTVTHNICQDNMCVVVDGEGENECTENSECAPPTSSDILPEPTLPPPIVPEVDDPPEEDPEDESREEEKKDYVAGPLLPPEDPPNIWEDFVMGMMENDLPLWSLLIAGLFSILSTAMLLWTYLSVEVSFRQLVLASINYLSSLFVAKKKDKMGRVYDSTTGSPIAGAIVSLYSYPQMKLVSSAFTDQKGGYYMVAGAGEYALSVTARGFIFPSMLSKKILSADPSQYFGQKIDTPKDTPINFKIPLDPGVVYKPSPKLFYRIILTSNLLRLTINSLGTVLSLLALWINPSGYNYFIATAYLFLWILEFIVENREIKFSKVVDESSGEPLDLALVRLFSEDGKLIKTTASDIVGRVLVENTNPSNHLLIERSGYKQSTFDIKKTGFVEGQKFKLQKY